MEQRAGGRVRPNFVVARTHHDSKILNCRGILIAEEITELADAAVIAVVAQSTVELREETYVYLARLVIKA